MFGERKINKVGDRIRFLEFSDGGKGGTVLEIDEPNSRALVQWDDDFPNSYVWFDSDRLVEVNGESV